MIKAVLFDFGGVIAEEGFKKGLLSIALKQGLEPNRFFTTARDLIYATGYVLGLTGESDYWTALRKASGIKGDDTELHDQILDRFFLRPDMIDSVQALKKKGLFVGILSDQTDWLEELDHKHRFFQYFDRVFNSYRLHKSKRDPSLFTDVCFSLGCAPQEVLFIDDGLDNIKRASAMGLKTILFLNREQFRDELRQAL